MLRYQMSPEGFASIVWDIQDRPMNVLSPESRLAFVDLIDRAINDPHVRGVLITSARDEFIAGADLAFIRNFRGAEPVAIMEQMRPMREALRRLEKSGKPTVAAINGTALGGGLEICLSCHHRIAADRPGMVLGLPEVSLGLLPGAGGTQRLPRMLGVAKALPLLLEGTRMSPRQALEAGVVDELVAPEDLVAAAEAWLRDQPATLQQPWDRKDFRMPGDASASPAVHRLFVAKGAQIQAETQGLQPAPEAILSCVFEGIRVPIDQGLAIEFAYFTSLVRGDVAQNTIRTMFFGMNEVRKLAARPKEPAKLLISKLGILGAGLMGSGLAEVASRAGLNVVLVDRDDQSAEAGRERVSVSFNRQVERGRMRRDTADEALARIFATADFSALAGSQAVIEAVFEDRAVKADVTARALAATGSDVLFASNTSKIAISRLADASSRPDRFIGMHFFSPVPRMPLLEIIRGRLTSDETLAHALDIAKILGKTPIVVNDAPGFYTSRCVGSYLNEGLIMLAAGVPAALVENCGRQAGMPIGPLALADEIGLDLMYQVRVQEQADLGKSAGEEFAILARMVNEENRRGRKGGGGFYDYAAEGGKRLWAGLEKLFASAAVEQSAAEISQRLLHVQAIEAARCFDEGVISSARDADIGSILGWGFARHTGGVASYIDTMGVPRFVEDCDGYAERFGARYAVPGRLRAMVAAGGAFHPT